MHCIGIDGNDVDFSLYQIPTSHYLQVDLSTQHTEILRQIKERFHNTQFDLVQSLEVAEHLPNEAAREFIALLTSLGNIVLFSAAIPYQGGTGHINEQPPMYWSALFEERGFVCFDVLRDEIWDMEYVEIWYRQNILIFANDIGAKWLKENGLTPKEARFLIHYESWKHIDEHIKYLESKLSKYRFLRQPAKCIKNIFHWK
ncbi:hypothetical protein Hc94105_0545 [Helicobacter cinaedi]|nr:hypothetical protein [Helicobacter cinaedi]BDB66357.1 hypothetical protein Hc94105_0545 [Helicobacter cinaedi]